MKASELQNWLVSDGIRDELSLIAQVTALTELGEVKPSEDFEKLSQSINWERLLLAGSILARSADRDNVEAALRIATAALNMKTHDRVRDAASVILEKLSNYRAVELAQSRGLLDHGVSNRLGVSARIESFVRTFDGSVLVDHSGDWLRVNKFQQEFWSEASNAKTWVSASAPTASGKTFLVLQWLLNEIAETEAKVAIYLAPTRALVSEIEENFRSVLKQNSVSNIEVTSLPLPIKYNDAFNGKNRVVFVLTQERLHLLTNVLDEELFVDLLIADEAHKVGDKNRGVVLQDAIERVARINPSMKIVFISPATQNPESLLDDAPSGVRKKAVDSDTPTVLQNIIFAKQRPGVSTKWDLSLRSVNATELSLGTLELKSRPVSLKKLLALIAASIGQKGGTLIYTNGAAEAEEVAFLIEQFVVDEQREEDAELIALADLARSGVHEEYLLANLARSGVAFHYGNMPSLLREEIERLFRVGKIRYLVCTSTLIEGVNLSCRTIVVRGPRKGQNQPMEPHDFWNLAGRAGRWGNEFQGNIICVDPNNRQAWPNGVPLRKRYSITRETDFVLADEHLLRFIETRWDRDPLSLSSASQLEQVCAYLLTAYLREGSIVSLPFTKRHSNELVSLVNEALGKIADRITIPASIAARHSTVSAIGLQRLLNYFQSYKGDIADLLPTTPEDDDVYPRLSRIMTIIDEEVYPAFMPVNLIPLHARIVIEWLKGFSLARIIKERIRYNRRHGRVISLPKLIRETMQLIEEVARFKAPKYIAAYMDVLKYHLHHIGRSDLISSDMDVGLALEFGVFTRTLISLMELGLSRMTAIAIHEKILSDDLDREQSREWIEKYNQQFEGMGISAVIIAEIRRKILDPSAGEPSSVTGG